MTHLARWAVCAALALSASPAQAERILVAAGRDLSAAMKDARDGDILVLQAGEHHGALSLNNRVIVEGEAGSVLIGPGEGSVVTLNAPGAVLRGLTIRGSGADLERMDSGVFIAQGATGAVVENNRIEGNLYGVFLHGAPDAVIRNNVITGRQGPRPNELGNGVSVWNAPGGQVVGNDISFGRDGVFSTASRRNTFSGNRFTNTRFAIHYMYTNDSIVADNVSTGNHAGYAIMYSNRLKVTGNVSERDRDHGFLFNYANGSQITGNVVRGSLQPASRWLQGGSTGADAREHGPVLDEGGSAQTGLRSAPGKCVFIYNANQNRFTGNQFEGCDIGVHFTAGSERNVIAGNAFIRNRTQVKYVGTRHLDWSLNGRGNFWSDHPAFDLNGDGVADAAFRPNDLTDRVMWASPQAKVLANAPAVQVIRWAQTQFPALLPGGVVDTHPLMAPPMKAPP